MTAYYKQRFMKGIFVFLALCFCFGGIWVYKLIWGKPTHFHLFVERVLVKKAIEDPELLTYLGVTDNTFFDFTSYRLTDISYAKNSLCLKQIQDSLDVLHEYNREHLGGQEKLTYDILEDYLQNILDSASFGFGSYVNSFQLSAFTPYPVNQFFGMQNCLPDFMVNIHQVINKTSAKNYIARLSQWDKKFSDLIEELKLRERNGVIPPNFVIGKVLNELTGFISVPYSENLLFLSFQSKLQKIQLTTFEKESLEKEALQEIETKVYPAYSQLIVFLQKQMAAATSDAGVWKFPHGREYYIKCLRYHTTTDDSPDVVHAFGLSEVKRIQAELRSLFDQLGYRDLEVMQAMKTLSEDPKFLYPETEAGRKAVLEDYRAIFESTKPKLTELFSQFPKGELQVEAIPDFRAKTSPMAYYEPGDLKGTRPGVFFVNTSNLKSHPKFGMPSLAYHEGIPGHHFQIALAQEIKNLPTFRRVVPFTAYIEGWALYCEQLAFEYRFTTDPYSNIGRLQSELMRAVRLVVDTGIHWQRWTRQEAIDYMMANTGMNEEEVEVEIERYAVLPGQACSYKIGMKKILELREKMKRQLGEHFDIKRFHQIILQNGAMPLTLLQSQVEAELSQSAKDGMSPVMQK